MLTAFGAPAVTFMVALYALEARDREQKVNAIFERYPA
jgi:hypothetical protein